MQILSKNKLLVHACCATCAGYVLDKLAAGFEPVLYYYNPNIHPLEEYLLRKNELEQYAAKKNIPFIEAEYEPQAWLDFIQGLESEPEKGLRCEQCFKFRLEMTASYAKEHAFELFTTTLTISPHKNSRTIMDVGKEIAKQKELIFLEENFKKQDGFKKTMEIAKRENFYRQKYCGCSFSKKCI